MNLKRWICGLLCMGIFSAAISMTSTEPMYAQTGQAVIEGVFVDQFQLAWWDKGSGGKYDGAYYKPMVPTGYHAVGYYGQSDYGAPNGRVLAVKALTADALRHPVDYQCVWTDRGSGANMDGAFWKPIPPAGYVAMGMVVSDRYGVKPALDKVVCVKQEYALKANIGTSVWNDSKTGANTAFGSWRMIAGAGGISAGTFFGITSHTLPSDHELLYCFNKNSIQMKLGTEDVMPLLTFDDTEKLALLQRYAPRVWLATDTDGQPEPYHPSSVEWAFPYLERFKNSDGNYWLRTKESLGSPSDVLGFFHGNVQSAPVYAFLVEKNDNKIDLVYFFYYPYNRGKTVLDTKFGNHVGDWEHITVRVDKISINGTSYAQPIQVYMSAHSFGGAYSWSAVTKVNGTHPVGYSAWGSHGMWKDAGNHEYETIPVIGTKLVDVCNEGLAWDTWNQVQGFYYNGQRGLNTQWPIWMSTNYGDAGTGDPANPATGPIYRWGNQQMGSSYFGYYRLEDGPTGPAGKNDVWDPNKLE